MTMVPRTWSFISDETVSQHIPIRQLIDDIESCLRRFSDPVDGGFIQPVRCKVFPPGAHGGLGLMPCISTHDQLLAVKVVTVYPGNVDLPTHQALIALYEAQHGCLKAFLSANSITELRTAAASAVAVKHLSKVKGNSGVLAVIGTGHQAASHVNILRSTGKFSEIRVYGRNKEKRRMFAEKYSVICCSSVEEATSGADVIVTATFSKEPLLFGRWVKSDALICVVGACLPTEREVDDELMLSSQIIVDTRDAASQESGDIIHSKVQIDAELGEIINGKKSVDWSRRRLFKSQGIAVEDLVAAKLALSSVPQDAPCELKVNYVTDNDVEKCVPSELIINSIESCLSKFSQPNGDMQPVRTVISIPRTDNRFYIMPISSQREQLLCAKLLTVFPSNSGTSAPVSQSKMTIFDYSSGSLRAIIEAGAISKLRTAAATAVAVRHLTKPTSSSLAIIGTGLLAPGHLKLLKYVRSFTEIRVCGRNFEKTKKFGSEHGCLACKSVEEAVSGADVIVTLTRSLVPVLWGRWVKQGALVCVVGAVMPTHREVDDDLINTCQVIVDSTEAASRESGDIIQSDATIEAELGEIINGTKSVDWSRTRLFKSQGIAVEDLVTAKLVLRTYGIS